MHFAFPRKARRTAFPRGYYASGIVSLLHNELLQPEAMRIFPVHRECRSGVFPSNISVRFRFATVSIRRLRSTESGKIVVSRRPQTVFGVKAKVPFPYIIDLQCRAVLKWIRERSNEPAWHFQPKWRRPWRGHVSNISRRVLNWSICSRCFSPCIEITAAGNLNVPRAAYFILICSSSSISLLLIDANLTFCLAMLREGTFPLK